MKNITIPILTLFITCLAFGQSLDRQVVGSSGATISNSNNSLSLTIGEALVSNISGSNNEVKQGFWVTNSILTLSAEDFESTIEVKLFPNPVVNELTINFNEINASDFEISLYDINGRKQKINIINDGSASKKINLEAMASGLYLIKVSQENSNNILTYKIIKK